MAKPVRPVVTALTLEGYRAFERAEVQLGRLTVILGRNNAGKSALCLAPHYFAHAFRADAPTPLMIGGDFGSPQAAIFRKQLSGMSVRFDLGESGAMRAVALGVTVLSERQHAQQVTRFTTELVSEASASTDSGEEAVALGLSDWKDVRRVIAASRVLPALTREIGALRGVRPLPDSEYLQVGYTPEQVGIRGEFAPAILFAAGAEGLRAVNEWFGKVQARLSIDTRGDRFEILVAGPADEAVNLTASGAGIAQALPLVVQLTLAEHLPRLWCVEQPELHLHPAAHPAIAELFLARLASDPGARFLIETHSDALVLRLRREVAAGRLAPSDLRIYFVDERAEPRSGSKVREIPLNDEGTPAWWPEGVFAEPEREYFAIRRELRRRRDNQS